MILLSPSGVGSSDLDFDSDYADWGSVGSRAYGHLARKMIFPCGCPIWGIHKEYNIFYFIHHKHQTLTTFCYNKQKKKNTMTPRLKKLPIGISTLSKIIEGDFVYVDKTPLALQLIESGGGYYFLSRPRRFGKSLFLDTLKSIFLGDKELFRGLYIYDKYDFVPHPIIRINFNNGRLTTKAEFNQRIYEIMYDNQKTLSIECPKEFSSSGCFDNLIKEAYLKYNQKVVILIDEYDKPILDNIEDTPVATLMREELKNFYSVIKGADEYIQFVFITGVSKFSKVSLFSGLNNLNDITLDENYSTICGYTQHDLETTFEEHLRGQDMAKIQEWYNGYKWLGEAVYNPFDILLFIDKNFAYKNYWFSTATPTFLLKLIEKNRYYLPDLEHILKDEELLDSFDVDNIELETLMWQSGYLTIDATRVTPSGITYALKIPNKEVLVSIMGRVANFLSKISNYTQSKNSMYDSLVERDFEAFEKHIKALFASIPYNLFSENNKMYEYEGYYNSIFYSYFKAFGVEAIAEDVTNKGRIDLTLKIPNGALYVIEFKLKGKANALEQKKSKKYHEKKKKKKREIYLIGIEFDKEERSVSLVEWERVG